MYPFLTRYNPSFNMDDLFNDFFRPAHNDIVGSRLTDTGRIVEVDVPGFELDQISVTVTSNTINIEAKNDHRNLKRSIRVPVATYDLSNVEANLKLGVLSVNVPFLKEKVPTERRIEIKSS